jgi:hypothetical protein
MNIQEAYQKAKPIYEKSEKVRNIKIKDQLDDLVFLIPISGTAVSSSYYNCINHWCKKNCQDIWTIDSGTPITNVIYRENRELYDSGNYSNNHIIIIFENPSDAMLFKMRWS